MVLNFVGSARDVMEGGVDGTVRMWILVCV